MGRASDLFSGKKPLKNDEKSLETGRAKKLFAEAEADNLSAFNTDLVSFSNQFTTQAKEREGTYQSSSDFATYRSGADMKIADLLNRATRSRDYVTKHGDLYEDKDAILSYIDSGIEWLNAAKADIGKEADYWSQFADEYDYQLKTDRFAPEAVTGQRDSWRQEREQIVKQIQSLQAQLHNHTAGGRGWNGAGSKSVRDQIKTLETQRAELDGKIESAANALLKHEQLQAQNAEYERIEGLDISVLEWEREALLAKQQEQTSKQHDYARQANFSGRSHDGEYNTLKAAAQSERAAADDYAAQIEKVNADIELAKRRDQRAEYETKRQSVDFAEKSAYKGSTKFGNPTFSLGGTMTSSGYADPLYDWVNGDEAAYHAILSQRRAGTGDDASMALTQLLNQMADPDQVIREMTQDERAMFNYLYDPENPAQAYGYLEFLRSDLNYRDRAKRQQEAAARAKEHPVLESLGTVITAPMRGLTYINQIADKADDGKIDQNAPYNKLNHTTTAIRQEVGKIAEKNWGKPGSFLYNTGMSMGDFLLTTAVSGGNQAIALSLMGTGAAADTVISAKDRGLSDDQAFALGTVAGAAEIAMEKIGMDALFGNMFKGRGALTYVLGNALAEGGEEGGTGLINLFADIIISQDQSEWTQKIKKYEAMGLPEDEAFIQAVLDQAGEIGLESLAGALSGSALATGGVAIDAADSYFTGRDFNRLGLSEEDVYAFIETGLENAPNTESYKIAKKLKEKWDAGEKTLTSYELGKLHKANRAAYQAGRVDYLEEVTQQENVPQAVADGQPASVSEVQTGTDITNPSVAQRGVESVSAVSDQQAAKNMAQVREYATIFGEHGSKALSAAYNEITAKLVSAQDAQAGFFAAYTAARDGKTLNAEEQRSVEKLTPGLRFAAETAGKADALRAEQAVYFGEDAELVKDDMLKRANLRSKDRRMLDAIAKNAGIKVRMVDKLVDERGYAADAQYKDGELLISLEAKDPVRAAFTHDLVHRIRVVSPEAYTTLASFVRDNMSRDNWNALVKGEAFRYGERGLDYLSEEMVARAFGTLMGDSVLLDQFVKDNRNAGQIILDAIRDLIAAIKRALNGQNVKLTAEQKADFAELQVKLEDMSKALENALKQMEADVKRNTKEDNKNTASEGGEVKYLIKRSNGGRVVWFDSDITKSKSPDEKYTEFVSEFLSNYISENGDYLATLSDSGKKVYAHENLPNEFPDSAYTKFLRNKKQDRFYAKMRAAGSLAELVEIATGRKWEKGKHHHNKDVKYGVYKYKSKFAFPSKDSGDNITAVHAFDCTLVVINASDGNKYLYDIIGIKEDTVTAAELFKKEVRKMQASQPKGVSVDSISSNGEKSNTQNSEFKNSLTLANDPATTELIQENTRLKEQVEKWKGQTKRTTTPTLRQGDVDKLTRHIVKDYDGTLDWHDIAGDVKALGEFILRGGEELTWSEVKERAMDIGRKIVNSAQVLVDGELESDLRELKGYLRSMKLAYTDTGEIPDFNQWRKRQFGKLTVGKDGLPVDVAYQELQGMFGEGFFPAHITHPGEQLLHIAQLVDDMQGVMENPFSADMEQAIQHAANALIDGLLSEQVRQTAPTFADRQAAKVDAVRAKSRESTKRQLDRVRADRDAKLEELKEKHRAKDKEGRERQSAGELRRKIGKHVSKLSQRLLKPSNEQHVPEGLRGAVAAMLEAINLEGPYTIDPETGKRVKNDRGEPTKRTTAFEALRKAYQQALTEGGLVIDPDLLGEDGNLAKVIEMRHIRLSDMSTEQLETVWRTIRAVEKSITDANKLLAGEKFAGVLELAQDIKASAATRKTKGNYGGLVGWGDKMLNVEMLDPLTFLHSFGKGGDALYRILRSARDQRTAILKHATELTVAATDGLTVKKLQRQKHTFTTESGDTITVTTAQLMSLYELNKRQQAQDHIYKGGIRPEVQKNGVSKDKTAKENLNAVLGKLDAPAESVRVTQEDVRKMLSALTEEQIKAADALQMIMETYLADEGNKASMAVYGYKKFMEKNYFPISSDPHQVQSKIGDVIEGQKRPRSVAEWGSAKGTVEHASNGLVLGDIFDVVAQHAVDMATYASHLAAMEDVNRVRNFQFRDKDGNRTGTMGDIIDRVMGRNGNAYLDKLLQDVSAGTAKGGGVSFAKLTANYKAASVGLNMRVALQQPTSYLRAAAVIDPKYLMQAIGKTGGWEKALKYAPIAQWKEWGNFEINQGRQLQDIMFGTDSKLDKARQNSMWLAGKMDSITWGAIWNACELELAQTRSELRKGSEEFYQAVAERFTDVIDQTQVVDNVLGRSQIMRNTDTMQKMATSYLGETTKQYNMLYRAFTDWSREQDNAKRSAALKKVGVTATFWVAANFMNAVAQSLWDAVRDDDEREEKYWERFMYHVLPNFFDNINPLGGIPYVKDVVSTLQGYEVKRMDMQAITGLISALQGVEKALRGEGRYTVVGSMANLLAEFGRIVGLPVATVKRDLMAIARNFAVEIGDWQLQYYIERAFNSLGSTYNRAEFYNILFGAAKAGDLDAARKIRKDMEANGVKPTSINSAMRSRYKTERAADRNFAMGARMRALLGIGE